MKLTEMMSTVSPMEQELATKNAAAQPISAEVESAKQMVAKWQSENEFIRQLESLYGQLESVERAIEEKQLVEDELQASLRELELKVEQAKSLTKLSEEEANAIRQRMLELRGGDKSN